MSNSFATNLLIPAVDSLVGKFLAFALRQDTVPIQNYVTTLQESPTAAIGADVRILLGLSMLEEFTHKDEEKQTFIRSNLDNLPGSWMLQLADMMQFLLYGHSCTVKVWEPRGDRWQVSKLQTLNPTRFDYEGGNGQIESIVYHLPDKDVKIPYGQVIHLKNQPYMTLGGNPRGVALLKRVTNFWELEKQLWATTALAGKRQATPLLVGKTDTSQETILLEADGVTPLRNDRGEVIQVNRGESMLRILRKMENSSVAAIDLTEEISAIQQQTDGEFLFRLIHLCQVMQLLCFFVPPTVALSGFSGVGDSNLNAGHREILRLVTRSQMLVLSDGLKEDLAKPLLQDNFNEQEDYGSFPVAKEDTADTVELLDKIGKIVYQGGFSREDLAVVNRMRQLAGIETTTEILTDPTPLPTNGRSQENRSFFVSGR